MMPAIFAESVFGLCCTLAIIIVRFGIDLVAPTAGPYALIYPATLISTLFGRWRAGLITAATSFLSVLYSVLPHRSALGLARASDGPRTVVNVAMVLVVLVFAEIFRRAVQRASAQRDSAIASLEQREARLRQLNLDLENEVAERTRDQSRTWNLSPDLLGVLNTEGYFEKSNPAWQATLGWSEEKIRTTKFFEFIHPDDLDRTYGAWDEVNKGNPILRFDNRYRRVDGSWRWLSWVVVPENGKFYGSARDITAEKDSETDLAAAQEALRQAQKMEAIGQLTGGVAHDFNNLLTVIVGSVELLRRTGTSDERRNRYIDAIGETADRATKLTSQLLAFARRQALKAETFEIGASLEGVIGIVKSLTGSRIVLESQLPSERCYVLADRSQFDTAIVNMAVNARDAMEGEGRITITAGSVSGVPAVRGHPPVTGNFIAVTITDNGHGIAAEDVARVFEPFFTTKEIGTGTGLGLSQVIGFAKQSDGEIRVESVVGEGSAFTLYLPRASSPQSADSPSEPTGLSNIGGDGVCVLVVEDNEQVGEFATSALRELGYDSILATNGTDALAALALNCDRFHVVFSDVVMPGMTGVELGVEVRRLYPNVPVILTSGYSHVLAENGTHGLELLHKPYSIEQLSRVLRKALTSSSKNGARLID